jgi:hypothetical protein
MKSLKILLTILILVNSSLTAQDTLQKRNIVFKVHIDDIHFKTSKGYLAAMNDSVIFLSDNPLKFSIANTNFNGLRDFDYQIIGQVRLQRKASVGRGIMFGTISGFVIVETYVLITSSQQTTYNFNTLERTIFLAVPGAILGGIIGAAIGAAIHKTFVIDGIRQKFKEMKSEMVNILN